jgi:DNA-binding HxlR family transcriptional regulator
MTTSIAAFLRRKGGIELLCVMNRDYSSGRFTDLDEEINVSHTTLSKRLGEAQDIGLIDVAVNHNPGATGTVYHITDLGRLSSGRCRVWESPKYT